MVEIELHKEISKYIEDGIKADCDPGNSYETIRKYLYKLCELLVNAPPIYEINFFKKLCERIAKYLFNKYESVRTLVFQIFRLSLKTYEQFTILLDYHVHIFIVRAFDLQTINRNESIESLKLTTLMFNFYNHWKMKHSSENLNSNCKFYRFSHSLIQSIFVIAKNFILESKKFSETIDSSANVFSKFFLELAVREPETIIDAVGTGWIVDFMLWHQADESIPIQICRILCSWLDNPHIRSKGKLSLVLQQIFAPLIEMNFSSFYIDRSDHTTCSLESKTVLNNISNIFIEFFHSWQGLIAFSIPEFNSNNSLVSPIRILDQLSNDSSADRRLYEVRVMLIDCICKLLDFSYAHRKFDSWTDATEFYSAAHGLNGNESLENDFIVAEYEYSIKNDQEHCEHVNLLFSFRALMLYFFVNSNIVQILSRLILTDFDSQLGIKATLLLADIILLGSMFLPVEWRYRVMSLPMLVESSCEVQLNATEKYNRESFTFSNSRNAPLILNRLDLLNEISFHKKGHSNLSNLHLFMQKFNSETRSYSNTRINLSEKSNVDKDIFGDIENMFAKICDGTKGKLMWPVVDRIVKLLETDHSLIIRHKHSEKCHKFFTDLLQYLSPLKQVGIANASFFDQDPFVVGCACRALRLLPPLCEVELYFEELIMKFIQECMNDLELNKINSGIFYHRNLESSYSMYYFAMIGGISSHRYGRKILEKSQILQR